MMDVDVLPFGQGILALMDAPGIPDTPRFMTPMYHCVLYISDHGPSYWLHQVQVLPLRKYRSFLFQSEVEITVLVNMWMGDWKKHGRINPFNPGTRALGTPSIDHYYNWMYQWDFLFRRINCDDDNKGATDLCPHNYFVHYKLLKLHFELGVFLKEEYVMLWAINIVLGGPSSIDCFIRMLLTSNPFRLVRNLSVMFGETNDAGIINPRGTLFMELMFVYNTVMKIMQLAYKP